jgi:hypothetical protein
VDRALQEIESWRRERKAENLRFYADAITNGQVRVIPGKETTERKSKCDVCYRPQKAGIRKFFYSNGVSFYFHTCEPCWTEIVVSADVHVPVIARISQGVTSS